MNIFFACLNVHNQYEGNTKKKEYLKPYKKKDDARFTWLENEFSPYLANWKESTESRPGNFLRMLDQIPQQIYEGQKLPPI